MKEGVEYSAKLKCFGNTRLSYGDRGLVSELHSCVNTFIYRLRIRKHFGNVFRKLLF